MVATIHGRERPLTGAIHSYRRYSCLTRKSSRLRPHMPGVLRWQSLRPQHGRNGRSSMQPSYRAADSAGADHGNSNWRPRRTQLQSAQQALQAMTRRSRHGATARRHPAQLLARPIGRRSSMLRRGSGTGGIHRTLRRRAKRHQRQCRTVAAALGHAVAGRSTANSSGAPMERHPTGCWLTRRSRTRAADSPRFKV